MCKLRPSFIHICDFPGENHRPATCRYACNCPERSHYGWVFSLQATDYNSTFRLSGGNTRTNTERMQMVVVIRDGQEWRYHCQYLHNGSWIFSEHLPCTMQKGTTHILHRGSNHFVLQLPGLLSVVGDCELVGDVEILNTHLVVFHLDGTWQIRMVGNDPTAMLNLPYITSSRGKVQMASRVVQWGMARHNGIPALLRQFRESDMAQHLATFQSLHGTVHINPQMQPPLRLEQLAVEGRATCRFGMKPTALKLAQQARCQSLVRLEFKKAEGEDPGNFHIIYYWQKKSRGKGAIGNM